MSDKAEAAGLNPDYIPPPFDYQTEREHEAHSRGRREGYFEGRDDFLYALIRGHSWALELLAKEREKFGIEATLEAAITAERRRIMEAK